MSTDLQVDLGTGIDLEQDESQEDSSDVSFAEDVFELANIHLLDTSSADTPMSVVSKVLDSIHIDASVSVIFSVQSGVQKLSSIHIGFD